MTCLILRTSIFYIFIFTRLLAYFLFFYYTTIITTTIKSYSFSTLGGILYYKLNIQHSLQQKKQSGDEYVYCTWYTFILGL